MILNDITDIISYQMATEGRYETIVLDTIYPKDMIISYLFESEKVMLDCIRWYNRIWSIRQNINLQLVNLPINSTSVNLNYNNIHSSFLTTRKEQQKRFLLEKVKFFSYVKGISYQFDVSFDVSTVYFYPKFEVQLDVPFIFGQENNATFDINGFYFFTILSFLHIYSLQSLFVVVNHNIFKNLTKSVSEYEYHAQFNFSVVNRDDRNVLITNTYDHLDFKTLYISRVYKKFFEG